MKIGFANQKGGVGKTTLNLLFALYLSEKEYQVTCLDFDEQQSLMTQWSAAYNLLTDEAPFQAYQCELDDAEKTLQQLVGNESIQLFDFPGSLYNPNSQILLENLDLIISPFAYEEKSVESTLTFAAIIKDLEIKADIVFVPNIIKSGVKYDIKDKVDILLQEYGEITPLISDWVEMQRLEIFFMSPRQQENSQRCFNFIHEQYLLIQ